MGLWGAINGFNLKKLSIHRTISSVWHVCLLLNNNNTDAEHNVREDEGIKSQEEECSKATVNDMFSVIAKNSASILNIVSLIGILQSVCRDH